MHFSGWVNKDTVQLYPEGLILWRIPAAMTWSLTNVKGSKDYILPDNPNILFRDGKGGEVGKR